MNQNVISADMVRENGRWVIKLTVPDWVLADMLGDFARTEERTPIYIQPPVIGGSLRGIVHHPTGSWGYIDHSSTPYLALAKFEKTEPKKPDDDDDNEVMRQWR